ncbi:MAG: hypothetical protein ACFE9M_06870 [Promethearchaeota archaeon]
MMSSNVDESENELKKSLKTCQSIAAPDSRDCQNCRYKHKGICTEFVENKSGNSSRNNLMNREKIIKIMTNSRIEDSEPVLNLKDLFYEKKVFIDRIRKDVLEIPQKAKYDNFKLLTDIQNVLQKCKHLTIKDKFLYCQSQRYFMKLYLREFNKQID